MFPLRARFRAVAASAPRAYWVVWWGTLINRLGGFVVPLMTIYLTTERGVTVTEAGAAVSAFGAGQVLASIAGGQLADRVGRRVTMLISLFSGAVVMTVLGTLTDLAAITVTVGVLGFAGELYRPAVAAFVSDVIPEGERLQAYGLLYWAVNLGWGFAATVGGLIAKADFHLLFVADAATMAAFGVLIAVAVPETRPAPVRAADAPPLPATRAWWRDRPFATFVGINFLLVLLPLQSGAALSAHMTAQGFSPAAYGLVLGCNGLFIIVAQPVLTARIARADADRVLVVSAVLYGIGMGVHGLASILVAHIAAVMIWTTAEILESPTRSALVAAMAPADARGRYQGAFVMTWGAGQLVAPRLGTLVWDRAGPRALWFGCVGLGMFVALALAATARDRRVRVAAAVRATLDGEGAGDRQRVARDREALVTPPG